MNTGVQKKQKCADTSFSVARNAGTTAQLGKQSSPAKREPAKARSSNPDCRQNAAPERRCTCWDDMPWAAHCKDCQIKVEINWEKRVAKVTSLTGGHVATCLNLGQEMQIVISGK
jgi:hypothetical protein